MFFFAYILSDFINNNEPQVQIVANLNANKQITEESGTERTENAMPNNDDREVKKKTHNNKRDEWAEKGMGVCERKIYDDDMYVYNKYRNELKWKIVGKLSLRF